MDPYYEERRVPQSMADLLGLTSISATSTGLPQNTEPSPFDPMTSRRSSVIFATVPRVSESEYEENRTPQSMEDMLGLRYRGEYCPPRAEVDVVVIEVDEGYDGMGGQTGSRSRRGNGVDYYDRRRRSGGVTFGNLSKPSSMMSGSRSSSMAGGSRASSMVGRSRPTSMVIVAEDSAENEGSSAGPSTGDSTLLSVRALEELNEKNETNEKKKKKRRRVSWATEPDPDEETINSPSSPGSINGDYFSESSRRAVPPQRVRYKSLLDGEPLPQPRNPGGGRSRASDVRPRSLAGYEYIHGAGELWSSESSSNSSTRGRSPGSSNGARRPQDLLPTYEQAISQAQRARVTAHNERLSSRRNITFGNQDDGSNQIMIAPTQRAQRETQRNSVHITPMSRTATIAPSPQASRTSTRDRRTSTATNTPPSPSLFSRLLRKHKSVEYMRPPPPQEGVPIEYDQFGNRKKLEPVNPVKKKGKQRWKFFMGSMEPPKQIFPMGLPFGLLK